MLSAKDTPAPSTDQHPSSPAWKEVEYSFGRHIGPTDLAERRKAMLIDVWTEKHAQRDMRPLNHLLRPHGT
jgi:hypothetical protein